MLHGKRQRAPHPAAPRAAGRHLSADLFIGRPHGGALVPAAVQLCVHFTWAILFPSSRTSETPPQSGSGRKEQTKSKAVPSIAGSILHSACSRPIVRLSMAGLRGRGPSCVFRPLLHIQKRSLRSTGVLCPALLSAKSGGILRRREWPLCYKKRDALQRLFSFALFTRSSRGRKER